MHQPKCAPRSTVAVSLVGTSAAGAGSWGLRFVPRWFQRVFFCFFVFFWFSKQVHSFKGCKGCLHPDFLWEDNYVCQNGVRFPGEKDLSFYSICLRVYWWTANLKVTGDTAEILRSEYLEFVRWVGNWSEKTPNVTDSRKHLPVIQRSLQRPIDNGQYPIGKPDFHRSQFWAMKSQGPHGCLGDLLGDGLYYPVYIGIIFA